MAPAIATPPRRHWNVNGDEPVATTLKVAVCPSTTDTVVAAVLLKPGATRVTLSVAGLLCTAPPGFVTTTVKLAASSLNCAGLTE